MGLVDCPHAPVRVVVGAGAGTEGPHCQGNREHALSVPAGASVWDGPRSQFLWGVLVDPCCCQGACSRKTCRAWQGSTHRLEARGSPGEAPPAQPAPCLPRAGSRVQRGAVCQCWLSWVKHVRPGMLHVSLFCSRFSSLRSFFLRFCSRSSHTLSFSCSPFLWGHRATPLWAPHLGVS